MILDLVLPRRCAGCAVPDQLWCTACAATTDSLFAVHRVATAQSPPVFATAPYAAAARRLVLAHKERGRRELAPVVGRILAAAVVRLGDRVPTGPPYWLVPAPSRPAAARRRGGNHVAAAAAHAARHLALRGLPAGLAPALRLGRGARDSVGLDARARVANLRRALGVNRSALPPPGAGTLVVDDVVTTGATVAACTAALAAAGVRVVAALALTATP